MDNDIRNQYAAPVLPVVESSGSQKDPPPSQKESLLLIENQRLRQELEKYKEKVETLQRQQHANDNTECSSAFHSPPEIIETPKEYSMMKDMTEEDGIQRDRVSFKDENFFRTVTDRSSWLVGLLVLQSMSSFIIARNEELLQNHAVIVQFLTMLVGAGGNAGNQAAVRVIRGLAVGSIDHTTTRPFLRRELAMGFCISLILTLSGFIRALVFFVPWAETQAITASLFIIVASSICIGALMPLGMKVVGIDPAHSSTTIQVVMDILGVLITVYICGLILDPIDYRML